MTFSPGNKHRYKSGRTITSKGYVRLKSGKHRDQFEHRAVILDLIESAECLPPPFTRDGGLPPGFEVHHQDNNRQHNCPMNLMVLQDVIHHAIEKGKREYLAWYEKHRKNQGLVKLSHVPGFMLENSKVPF